MTEKELLNTLFTRTTEVTPLRLFSALLGATQISDLNNMIYGIIQRMENHSNPLPDTFYQALWSVLLGISEKLVGHFPLYDATPAAHIAHRATLILTNIANKEKATLNTHLLNLMTADISSMAPIHQTIINTARFICATRNDHGIESPIKNSLETNIGHSDHLSKYNPFIIYTLLHSLLTSSNNHQALELALCIADQYITKLKWRKTASTVAFILYFITTNHFFSCKPVRQLLLEKLISSLQASSHNPELYTEICEHIEFFNSHKISGNFIIGRGTSAALLFTPFQPDIALKYFEADLDHNNPQAVKQRTGEYQRELSILSSIAALNPPNPYLLLHYPALKPTPLRIIVEFHHAITLYDLIAEAFFKLNKPNSSAAQITTRLIAAAKIIMMLLYGLKDLGKLKISHNDFNPRNTLLTPEGEVKIIDYANSSKIGDDSYTCPASLKQPQSLQKSLPKGRDIWALMCTLAYMLQGSSPYSAERIKKHSRQRKRFVENFQDPKFTGDNDALKKHAKELLDNPEARSPHDLSCIAATLHNMEFVPNLTKPSILQHNSPQARLLTILKTAVNSILNFDKKPRIQPNQKGGAAGLYQHLLNKFAKLELTQDITEENLAAGKLRLPNELLTVIQRKARDGFYASTHLEYSDLLPQEPAPSPETTSGSPTSTARSSTSTSESEESTPHLSHAAPPTLVPPQLEGPWDDYLRHEANAFLGDPLEIDYTTLGEANNSPAKRRCPKGSIADYQESVVPLQKQSTSPMAHDAQTEASTQAPSKRGTSPYTVSMAATLFAPPDPLRQASDSALAQLNNLFDPNVETPNTLRQFLGA